MRKSAENPFTGDLPSLVVAGAGRARGQPVRAGPGALAPSLRSTPGVAPLFTGTSERKMAPARVAFAEEGEETEGGGLHHAGGGGPRIPSRWRSGQQQTACPLCTGKTLSATTWLRVVGLVPKDFDWSVEVGGLGGQASRSGRRCWRTGVSHRTPGAVAVRVAHTSLSSIGSAV